MKYFRAVIVFLVLGLLSIMPVMGVTTYLGGSPEISAAISGTNEYTPGQDTTITLIVWNTGVNSLEFTTIGTIARDDLPTTAKMVTVGLASADAPVIVKSDPQIVGDIISQGMATVAFKTKITSDANEGEYQLPLTVTYTYLQSSQQEASESVQFNYRQVNKTIPITIKVKPLVNVEILEALPENLNVGAEGFLNLKIKNTGSEDGKKASVKIIRSGASPIIPIDNSVFIGDFPRNGEVTCRYKVAVSHEAENQTYPVDVIVTYENREGDVVTSTPDTVGIPVLGKIMFTIVSRNVTVMQGSQNVVEVVYQNSGATTAYNAQARLSVVEPFQSSDDTAYLGDLKPGGNATARYQVTTDDAAVARQYYLDTEVRYRDALDNSQVSDTFNVPVQVQAKPVWSGMMQALAAIGVIAIICIGAGYYLLIMRKKK